MDKFLPTPARRGETLATFSLVEDHRSGVILLTIVERSEPKPFSIIGPVLRNLAGGVLLAGFLAAVAGAVLVAEIAGSAAQ